MTDRPDPPPSDSGGEDSRAEQVLSQALRLMAGGGKSADPKPASISATAEQANKRRLTSGQLILLAAIVGLLIGICAGLLSLML